MVTPRLPKQICSRPFGEEELTKIRSILQKGSCEPINRSEVARRVCSVLDWHNVQGKPKEMGARVALIKLHRQGWIKLPEPTHRVNNNNRKIEQFTDIAIPQPPDSELNCRLSALGTIKLRMVEKKEDSQLWNGMIDRYHYLGHSPLSGAQVRYLIESERGLIGAIGFGAAALSLKARDRWIGWSQRQCNQRRELIVNNRRFLILPWIRVQNLASHILSKASYQLQQNFLERYGYRPLLLETFVEQQRFTGGCYRAANWVLVGLTTGRGRNDRSKKSDRNKNGTPLPIKQIWLYPLHRKARQQLTAPLDELIDQRAKP